MKIRRSFRDAQQATSRVRSKSYQCTATTTQSSPWLKLITSNVQCASAWCARHRRACDCGRARVRGAPAAAAAAVLEGAADGPHCAGAARTGTPICALPCAPPPRRLRTHSLPSPLCSRRIAPCRVRGVPWSPRGRRSWAAAAGADCSWSFVSGDEVRLNWLLSDNT